MRPGQYPGEKKSDDGSNPQTVTGIEHDYGEAENDENVPEKDEFHVNLLEKENPSRSLSRTKKNNYRIAQDELLGKEGKLTGKGGNREG
jgi:hypothetical protein